MGTVRKRRNYLVVVNGVPIRIRTDTPITLTEARSLAVRQFLGDVGRMIIATDLQPGRTVR